MASPQTDRLNTAHKHKCPQIRSPPKKKQSCKTQISSCPVRWSMFKTSKNLPGRRCAEVQQKLQLRPGTIGGGPGAFAQTNGSMHQKENQNPLRVQIPLMHIRLLQMLHYALPVCSTISILHPTWHPPFQGMPLFGAHDYLWNLLPPIQICNTVCMTLPRIGHCSCPPLWPFCPKALTPTRPPALYNPLDVGISPNLCTLEDNCSSTITTVGTTMEGRQLFLLVGSAPVFTQVYLIICVLRQGLFPIVLPSVLPVNVEKTARI